MKSNKKNKLHYWSDCFYANRIPFSALSCSKGKRASMTVEASLVLPVFLFAMILIGYIGVLIRCQDEVQWNLTRVAREASAEYGATGNKAYKSSLLYKTKLMTYMEGSGISVSLLHSQFLKENDEIDLIADYRVNLPFHLLTVRSRAFRQRVHTRAFVGVESRDNTEDANDRTVYVTAAGKVYHIKRDCPYLKLSLSQVQFGDLEALRNQGGGKYKECGRCCRNKKFYNADNVWITNYGDRYHSTRSCSGIRRSVRAIKQSEVGNRIPCSKCGQ